MPDEDRPPHRTYRAGRPGPESVSAGYSYGQGLDGQRFWRQCVGHHLQIKDDLRNLHQCLMRLTRWWATEEFRMSDPDRLTSHDKTFDRDTPGLILRIIEVAFVAALFWHTVITAGML
jgi:hypothetical protein